MRISAKTQADAKRFMPGVKWTCVPKGGHGPAIHEVLRSESNDWLVTELRDGDVTLEYRSDGTSFTGPDFQSAFEATFDHTVSKLAALHAAKKVGGNGN